MTAKLIAACREFRHWALTHREEFGLLFGTPLPGLEPLHNDKIDECALDFAGTFYDAVPGAVAAAPVPGPGRRPDRPRLLAQLGRYSAGSGPTCRRGAC